MSAGPAGYIGQPLQRKEDRRLLLGRGCFVADIRLAGMLHAAVLRSPHAHARIAGIDTAAASALPGVASVLTGADAAERIAPFPESFEVHPRRWMAAVEPYIRAPRPRVLACGKVCYVGEPVAIVVARDRFVAQDALELIQVEYDPVPAVVDPYEASRPGARRVHDDIPDNVVLRFRVAKGDPAAARAAGTHVLRERFRHHRYCGVPMEGRGVVAQYDERTDTLTVWSSSQVVHAVRRQIASMIGVAEEAVRVVAPDIGGGFGPKVVVYPEDVLVPYLARALRRPVKWIESRIEHFLATTHARDQVHDVEVAFDAEGRVLAFRDAFVLDNGAYNPMGLTDAYNTAAHIQGPYRIPHLEVEGTCVTTNKVPNAPYRGAGRPEAVFVVERVMDMIADRLGLDPAEVRLRNMVRPEEMPYAAGVRYRDGEPIVYDSGDYPRQLRAALAAAGYEEVRRRQDEWRRQGRCVGVGIACYVEGTGVGPHEGATVRIDPSGQIIIATGAVPHGQGHATAFAQIAADLWGVAPDRVTLMAGDTGLIGYGVGTFASRSTVTVGSAVYHATRQLMAKVRTIAGALLEAAPEDLVVAGGTVAVRGVPGRHVTLGDVARAARPGWDHGRPSGVDAGLEATHYFVPPTVTWASATHVAVVEVDTGTGQVRILTYVVSHDAGRLVNPLLADGQVHGGVAQGIGGAMYEEVVYNEEGQPVTTTFMDYLVPTAMEIPRIEVLHMEHASPGNPLGVKGLGEGGAIAPPAALANAVADALRPFGARVTALPLHVSRVLELVRRGEAP